MNWPEQYRAKAERWAKLLGKLPGVQAIWLSGSMASGQATEESDIDFFIVAHYGQIWTARFFCFVVLKLCWQLAKPCAHAGKICPNHFITDQSLEIREQDEYAARLFSANIPLFDPDNIFPQFVHANQKWIADFGLKFSHKVPKKSTQKIPPKKLSMLEKLLEAVLEPLQAFIIKRNPDFHRKQACIILSDVELRFHPVPKNKS